MNKFCNIRFAAVADAPQLLEIYAPFVSSVDHKLSDVSFEYIVPSQEEFAERIAAVLQNYPYLVCEQEGKLLGYVYAHPYIPRAAYQWGAEVTIYLAPAGQCRGLGAVLYEALEEILKLQGIITTYACITASNLHSVKMHEALGYHLAGTFKGCGFKQGRWLDMVWLEKVLQPHPAVPELFQSWDKIPAKLIQEILSQASAKASDLAL